MPLMVRLQSSAKQATIRACSIQNKQFTLLILRNLSSGKQNDENKVLIPEPTWSIQDLQLTSAKEPVSTHELKNLAQRSLLDIRYLEDTGSMRRDLANMLHCLEQIKKVNLPDVSNEEIYDLPRGVTAAPLRRSDSDPFEEEEKEEAKSIWGSYLKHKTVKRKGENYFAVATSRHKQ